LVSEQQQNLPSCFCFIVRSSLPNRPALICFHLPFFCFFFYFWLSPPDRFASPFLLTVDNQELQHGVVAAAPISQSSLAAATASIVPLNSSLDIMNRTVIIPLPNTQQVISLQLSNTNFFYRRMQMKPFLLGQGMHFFVDGTSPWPPSHLISTATSLPSINPSYLS